MDTLMYVGFWKRVAASLLDCIIMIPLLVINSFLQSYSFSHRVIWPEIVTVLFAYVYFIYFVSKYGGTPGKLLFKINIINGNASNISVIQSTIRYLSYMSSSIVSIFTYAHVFKMMPPTIKATGFLSVGKIVQQYSGPFNLLSTLCGFIVMIDVLILLFNKKKRTLHDFLADTYVVEKNSLPI